MCTHPHRHKECAVRGKKSFKGKKDSEMEVRMESRANRKMEEERKNTRIC